MLLNLILILGSLVLAGTQVYKATTTHQANEPPRLPPVAPDPANEQDTPLHRHLEKSQEQLNQNLAIGLTSLGFAGAGSLLYPPLLLASFPGFFYLSQQVFEDARQAWGKNHTVGVDALSLLVKVLLFAHGNFVFANLSTTSYAFNRRLLHAVKDNSKKNVIDVFKQRPRSVFVMYDDDLELEVPFERIKAGDVVVVHAGEMIPVDGIIVAGHAAIDQHFLTGEAQPAEKKSGELVFALTVVLSGQIRVRVEKTGEATTAAQIGQILNNTVDFKSSLQVRAEQMTNKTVVPTLIAAGAVLPFIGVSGTSGFLYAHPKYKTIITSSVNMLTTLNLASRKGILIKDGRTLDLLNEVDTMVFDKTGTLTLAQPHVAQIHTYQGFSENDVLHYAMTAEYKQSHPIARAILEHAELFKLQPALVSDAEYKIGYGITVTTEQTVVQVGSARFMEIAGIQLSPELQELQSDCHLQGHSLVIVAINRQTIGAIELHATVRPEIKEIVRGLRQRGIKSFYIISGDHAAPTARLAKELEIDHYFAETLPEQKADLIAQLQQQGKSVCYVGDGINDSIAMKKAKVSVSLQGASTIAIDTAQVVLMDESLIHLCTLFDVAKEFDTNMKRALTIVIAPHVLALGGTLFLDFGFLSSYILANLGLFSGIAYAMLPLWRHTQEAHRLAAPKKPETKFLQET